MRFLSVELIISINQIVLDVVRVKKADTHKLLSPAKLENIIEESKIHSSDVWDVAVFLLKRLVQDHVFDSGNRRTAIMATKIFLMMNNEEWIFSDSTHFDERALQGVREGYYTDEEIQNWIKKGKIRKFIR